MSWARFDDRYDDSKKIRRAWKRNKAAVGLHCMAITFSSRNESDGLVDIDWIEARLPIAKERRKVLEVLVDLCLFEVVDEEHWRVHDYLDYNPSRADLEAKRRKDSERKALGGSRSRRTDSARNPNGIHAESERNPDGVAADSVSPVPSRPVKGANAPVAQLRSDDVRTVFDEWVRATGRTSRTVLDDKRRRLIRNALKTYPIADVLDAVRGWRNSPHHRGENDTRTVFNDLELLLRDNAHIEKFRDLERSVAATNGAGSFTDRVNARSQAGLE